MMPHVHLLIGLIGANIFVFTGLNLSYSIWFILGSVLPDIDFIFNMIIKKNSHRQLATHFPLLYLLGALLLLFLDLPFYWLFLGALIHTFIDALDWEIHLFAPLLKRSFTILSLNYEEIAKNRNIISFLKKYYQERKIMVIEIPLFFLWIFTCFLN